MCENWAFTSLCAKFGLHVLITSQVMGRDLILSSAV